jgi:hypothetical protein
VLDPSEYERQSHRQAGRGLTVALNAPWAASWRIVGWNSFAQRALAGAGHRNRLISVAKSEHGKLHIISE